MDGDDALEYLEKAQVLPDIILLDVMMPAMSGFEVGLATELFPYFHMREICLRGWGGEDDNQRPPSVARLFIHNFLFFYPSKYRFAVRSARSTRRAYCQLSCSQPRALLRSLPKGLNQGPMIT